MFHTEKRKELLKLLENDSMLIILSDKLNEMDKNFYYLTQVRQSRCIYGATKINGETLEYLFIPKPDEMKIRWEGRMADKTEMSEISGISNILYANEFAGWVNRTLSDSLVKAVYFNLDPTDNNVLQPSYMECNKLREKYPWIDCRNVYNHIANMRVFKTEEELQKIRKAMDITKDGIEKLMKGTRDCTYEYQLKAIFEYELCMQGVQKPAFETNVSSGGNEFCLHYNELDSKISRQGLVLIDLGAQVDGYCVDISRVFPACGKFDETQKRIYSIALKANKEAMDIIKPGITFGDILTKCKSVVFEGLKDLGLVDSFEDLSRYFWHGVTHYVGLDVHDVGTYNQPVAADMVFTIDAGIYIPEWKVGLRVEDNVLVTENGYEHLSAGIPREIDQIEAILA